MLEAVEAARGLAALGVVVHHSNSAAMSFSGPQFYPFAIGEYGVDFFFVLSGFIIFYVHAADIGQPGQAHDYVVKRAVRLLPLLWLVVLSFILVRHLVGLPDLAPDQIANSLFLYPSLQPPTPYVIWTLRHEALFYIAFLAFVASRRLGQVVFGVWTFAVLVQLALAATGQAIQGLASFFLSTFQLDFVLGGVVAYIHRKYRFPVSSRPLLAASVIAAIVLVAGDLAGIHRNGIADYVSVAATYWTLVLGLAFAGVLHGVMCLGKYRTVAPWLSLLGGASYAVYLVHTPVNSVVQRAVAQLPESLREVGVGNVLVIAGGLLGGIGVHILVEKRMIRALRRRLLARPA